MTVVMSGGALVGVPMKTTTGWRTMEGPTSGVIPLLTSGDEFRAATYTAMVRSQPWVYAAIRTLVKGRLRVPIGAYVGDESDTREQVRSGDLPRLLSRPAARRRQSQLMVRYYFDYYTHAKALIWKRRPSIAAPPNELWHIPANCVQVIRDGLEVLGFNVYLGGEIFSLSPEDAIYDVYLESGDQIAPEMAPMEALRRTLALEDAALTWQSESMRGGVMPRTAFVIPKEIRTPGTDELSRMRSELQALYAGPSAAKNFAILGGGMTATTIGSTPVDVELIAQRKLSREEVAAAFGITPPLIGILDRATFNNVQELVRQFYLLTLGPDVIQTEDVWQAQLVDCEPAWDGMFVSYDTTDVMRPDPEAQSRMNLMDMQSGTTTINGRRYVRKDAPIGDPKDPENPANMPWIAGNGYPLGFIPEHVKADIVAPATIQEGTEPQPATPQDLGTQLTMSAFTHGSGVTPAPAPREEDE